MSNSIANKHETLMHVLQYKQGVSEQPVYMKLYLLVYLQIISSPTEVQQF